MDKPFVSLTMRQKNFEYDKFDKRSVAALGSLRTPVPKSFAHSVFFFLFLSPFSPNGSLKNGSTSV